MRTATGNSKTAYNYAHTTTPKAAWSHRYTAAKKKRQTDRSRNRRTDEVPFIAGCSHFTRKTTKFRAPASSPKHSPCNIMQPFQWDLQPQMPKNPINMHWQHTQSSFKSPLHCGKKKRQTNRSRNRRTDKVPFIAGCSHFTRRNTRFCAPVSSPKHSPCNVMQPFQWDLQRQIPKHPQLRTHNHTQSSLKPPLHCGNKKTTNRPQPQPPHKRGTFHRRLQPLYTEKHKISCSSFLPKT